jgi:hypothetical protein
MRENDGGGNLIKIYCKNICKCHNDSPCTTNKNVKKQGKKIYENDSG